jgi:hypothetical protein
MNNIGSSLVVMVAHMNLDFTTFDLEQHALQYTSLVGEMMIFIRQ